MTMRGNIEEFEDDALAGQVPEFIETPTVQEQPKQEQPVEKTKISSNILNRNSIDKDEIDAYRGSSNSPKLGDNLFEHNEARDGWINVDRNLLTARNIFYPEDWKFLIRPATVEVIRNWSMLDENDGNSIDDIFNEILKYCLSIKTSTGNRSWQDINSWDRLFFILLIREYTFVNGENNIEFYEDCYECDSSVRFTLESQALMYDIPDESVMQYYDADTRIWRIDPADFDVDGNELVLYAPTIEKDMNIKAWLISEYQENDKKKFDNVFIKFLPWMLQKVSKDTKAAKMQIRKAEVQFKSWDTEMFSFVNDVIKNIMVTPSTDISAVCQNCGSEVAVKIRFPNGVGALFNVVNRRTKFGTK